MAGSHGALDDRSNGVYDEACRQVVASSRLGTSRRLGVALELHDPCTVLPELRSGGRVDRVVDARMHGTEAAEQLRVRRVHHDVDAQLRDISQPEGHGRRGDEGGMWRYRRHGATVDDPAVLKLAGQDAVEQGRELFRQDSGRAHGQQRPEQLPSVVSLPRPFGRRAEGVWNLLAEQPWNQLTDGRGSVLTVESSTALERITEAHALRVRG